MSEQSVYNWKRQFLDASREGLEKEARQRSSRELQLEAENEELKAALGEAHVQLRVYRKGAEFLRLDLEKQTTGLRCCIVRATSVTNRNKQVAAPAERTGKRSGRLGGGASTETRKTLP